MRIGVVAVLVVVSCTGDNAIPPWAPLEVASGLNVVVQPDDAISGRVLPRQPVVAVLDSRSQIATNVSALVTARIASGNGSLSGTSMVQVVNGIATFNDLRVSGTGPHVMQFSASGMRPATSESFAVVQMPASLAVMTQPAGGTVGAPLPTQPIIAVVDEGGVPIDTASVPVTAAIVSGTGTLSGTTTVNAVAGVARFSDLTVSARGPHQLQFSSTGLNAAVSGTFSMSDVAGTATRLVVATQPAGAVSGTAFTQQPVIEVRDDSDQRVAGASAAITASLATGAGTLSGTTTVTAIDGIAVFTDLSIQGSGPHALRFSATSLASATSTSISVAPGAATQLAITRQPSSSVQNGVAFPIQPIIQLADATNTAVPLAGVPVTVTIATGGGTLGGTTTISTNPLGIASFTNLSITGTLGARTLAFTSPSYAGATSTSVMVGAGRATQLAMVTQPSSTAPNAAPLAIQPAVQLLDADGNPFLQAGAIVTAAVSSGGTLGGTVTATTNASGVATFSDLSITGSAGSYTLTFGSVTLVSVTSAPIALTAGAAVKLTVTTQPSSTAANSVPFVSQPIIQLRDVSDNAVPQIGVAVSATIVTGGGILGGTLSIATDATGAARFADLAITGTIGNRTLRFSSSGLTGVTSTTISVTAGPATKLSVTTQPSAVATTGLPFGRQPVIQLRDVSNNVVSQGGVAITAAISSGSGTLGGTATVTTNSSGVASFTDLSITGTPGDHVLSFAGSGLTSATSNPVSITGPATQLTITTQPSSTASSGVSFAPQPVIQLRDASGAAVNQAGVAVVAAIASGTGTLNGTATATTNANGAATFTNLSIVGLGTYTLSFSATGLTGVTSGVITVTQGVTPLITMSFDGYASTADLIGDCTRWDCVEQLGTANMTLDATVAPPGATKSMRYHYNHGGNGCNSITLMRSFRFPTRQQEVWAEFKIRWSSNFTTANTACLPNDHKLIFGDTEADQSGRWAFYVGAGSPPAHALQAERPSASGGSVSYLNQNSNPSVAAQDLWDGQWHVVRLHIKHSTTASSGDGILQVWVDGVLKHDERGFNTAKPASEGGGADRITGFSFAHNKDDGPPGVDMFLWWGPITVYNNNPGW